MAVLVDSCSSSAKTAAHQEPMTSAASFWVDDRSSRRVQSACRVRLPVPECTTRSVCTTYLLPGSLCSTSAAVTHLGQNVKGQAQGLTPGRQGRGCGCWLAICWAHTLPGAGPPHESSGHPPCTASTVACSHASACAMVIDQAASGYAAA